MSQKIVLTGVKPTDQPHIGNYLGAIRPALEMAQNENSKALFFIADYHALTSIFDPKYMREMTYDVAATWLACGLDPEKTIMYRQSDIPEIFEFTWILSCSTAKGLMNRAHAYKAKQTENEEQGKTDMDFGINVGLYTYPVLMSADILLFSTDKVPVGEDQVQHVEIVRDIAQKFNRTYGEIIKLPECALAKNTKLVMGLDGRKMSKSYNNHIPLYSPSKKLRKLIMKIKTDSSPPEAPKNPDDSILFDLYKQFATPKQVEELKAKYIKGVGWGEVKQDLFEVIDEVLTPKREIYNHFMSHREELDKILFSGAKKARAIAQPLLKKVRHAVGC